MLWLNCNSKGRANVPLACPDPMFPSWLDSRLDWDMGDIHQQHGKDRCTEMIFHLVWWNVFLLLLNKICKDLISSLYIDGLKGGPVLLSNSQAEILCNLGPTFSPISLLWHWQYSFIWILWRLLTIPQQLLSLQLSLDETRALRPELRHICVNPTSHRGGKFCNAPWQRFT